MNAVEDPLWIGLVVDCIERGDQVEPCFGSVFAEAGQIVTFEADIGQAIRRRLLACLVQGLGREVVSGEARVGIACRQVEQ